MIDDYKDEFLLRLQQDFLHAGSGVKTDLKIDVSLLEVSEITVADNFAILKAKEE